MAPSGDDFDVLYTFSQTDANGNNMDGADCYEPLVETKPGVFYGAATLGGTNGNGVVFRYSLRKPSVVEVVHDFSALTTGAELGRREPTCPADSWARWDAVLDGFERGHEWQRCRLPHPA